MMNQRYSRDGHQMKLTRKAAVIITVIVLAAVILLPLTLKSFKSVPAGHTAVATFFGEIQKEPYGEGLHFPVNPLYSWYEYDVRQKTHKESVEVPSQDQLTTNIEVSIQYRLDRDMAARMLGETGLAEQMVNVHLIPTVRSVLREQGKRVEKAEHFFLEDTQQTIQANMLEQLKSYCGEKGIEIDAVLLRDITLPEFIKQAIESKKQREQEAEKQKAELDRFKTEQEQLVAEAEAKRRAAEEEAEQRKVLADARAYEIEKINEAVRENPAYLQLEALKTLQAMAGDPAAKLYFLDSNSPMPLPLMNIGEPLMQQPQQQVQDGEDAQRDRAASPRSTRRTSNN